MLATLPILKEDFVEIFYDHDNQIIYAKWIGFLRLSEVVKGCTTMTDMIKKHKISKHLSDHTDLRILSKEVQNYLIQEWFPEVCEAGLKKVGVLLSKDEYAQDTVSIVNNKAQKETLVISTFTKLEDCNGWLSI